MIKTLSVKEIRSLGVLHEINRLLLHPLGLALYCEIPEDPEEFKDGTILGIFDGRNDPEGYIFTTLKTDKMESFKKLQEEKHNIREKQLGFVIQEKDFDKKD